MPFAGRDMAAGSLGSAISCNLKRAPCQKTSATLPPWPWDMAAVRPILPLGCPSAHPTLWVSAPPGIQRCYCSVHRSFVGSLYEFCWVRCMLHDSGGLPVNAWYSCHVGALALRSLSMCMQKACLESSRPSGGSQDSEDGVRQLTLTGESAHACSCGQGITPAGLVGRFKNGQLGAGMHACKICRTPACKKTLCVLGCCVCCMHRAALHCGLAQGRCNLPEEQ